MNKPNRQAAMKTGPTTHKIIIDEDIGLVFDSEDELYQHFQNEIQILEKDFFSSRNSVTDFPEIDFQKYEENLSDTLENPDEIWQDQQTFSGKRLMIYVKDFTHFKNSNQNSNQNPDQTPEESLFHIAICYVTAETPSFVYLHFPTRDRDLVKKYCRGELIYDRGEEEGFLGAVEGDALSEGDEMATGLYLAMLKLRSSVDIHEMDFQKFAHCRENTVEEADEIWRAADSKGNVLVNFIKDFSEEEEHQELWYIVVTIEDAPSNSHVLLFSFPTSDRSLVDRYRQGDNLQAEEVIQESSH